MNLTTPQNLVITGVAIIGFGGATFLSKLAVKDNSPQLIISIIWMLAGIAGVVYYCLQNYNGTATLNNKLVTIILIVGSLVCGLIGEWAYYSGIKSMNISIFGPLVATYPIVATFLAVVILKEKLTLPQVSGTILVISGMWLIIKK